jgi:hypothetical protein
MMMHRLANPKPVLQFVVKVLLFYTVPAVLLCHSSEWFAADQLTLNLNTKSTIVCQSAVSTDCNIKHIDETGDINMSLFSN